MRFDGAAIACEDCRRRYEVVDGIPVLLPCAETGLKRRQREFFDAEGDDEYETVRPHGAPDFHRWLLGEKFRRATSQLGSVIPGGSALTVCSGSGMDAENLERAGARPVVCSDISLGAARRARERARRFGLSLIPMVADAEHLPFADGAFDLVYVHDGLHHLEDPDVGLLEMARVARTAVSVTEPAQAKATAAAVKVGLSIDHEESGNRVMRMRPEDVSAALESRGFVVRSAERYAMLYRHEAGPAAKALSAPGVRRLSPGAWRALNASIGRAGNKLAVQAVRPAVR